MNKSVMKTKAVTLVLSDLHIGQGHRLADGAVNFFEDFREDKRFASLLNHYREAYGRTPIELVINGDFIEFLRVEKHGSHPDVMFESMAIQQVKSALAGHPRVFSSLKSFLDDERHSMVIVIGEGDCGLLWPGVQEVLKEAIGRKLRFYQRSYLKNRIYFEHGNQYDEISRIPKRFTEPDRKTGMPILQLPWAAFFISDYIVPIRRLRPNFGKVRPLYAYFIWMLMFDIGFALKMMMRFFRIFLNQRMFRFSIGYGYFRTLQVLKESAFRKDLEYYAEEILRSGDIRAVFFGHSHVPAYKRFRSGKEYVNTGTWTDTVSLDIRRLGRRTLLTYALIETDKSDNTVIRVLHWRGRHEPVRDFI